MIRAMCCVLIPEDNGVKSRFRGEERDVYSWTFELLLWVQNVQTLGTFIDRKTSLWSVFSSKTKKVTWKCHIKLCINDFVDIIDTKLHREKFKVLSSGLQIQHTGSQFYSTLCLIDLSCFCLPIFFTKLRRLKVQDKFWSWPLFVRVIL